MRDESHKTPIRRLLEQLDDWRNSMEWSRETLAQVIVEAHETTQGPERLRVKFEAGISDAFRRAATNANRIFRWFDDDAKETNLLSVNFLPTVLASLPRERAIDWLNNFLRPLGLAVHGIQQSGVTIDAQQALCEMLKEDSESHQAIAKLTINQSRESLLSAHKELTDSIETTTRIRDNINVAISQGGA